MSEPGSGRGMGRRFGPAWAVTAAVLWAAATPAGAADGQSPVRLSAHDGRETMTVGMLLQPIFQTDTVAGDTSVADACFRRIRVVGNAQAGHFNPSTFRT